MNTLYLIDRQYEEAAHVNPCALTTTHFAYLVL